MVDGSVWAAPPASDQHQTVPNATPTYTSTPVPTATPNTGNDDNDDSDDDSEGEQPVRTPTPTPEIQQIFPTPDPNATAPSEPQPEGQNISQPALTGRVAVIVLNVREGPGPHYKVMGTIFNDKQVEVLGRTADSSWWLICCAFGQEQPGWVDSQFVEPEFDSAQIDELIPVVDEEPDEQSASPLSESSLLLDIVQQPMYAWQEQEIELLFVVENTGDASLARVELRNELPLALELVNVDASGGGSLKESISNQGTTIFAVQWPEVAAGERITTTVTVRIAADLPDASIIDNLAVVGAQNAPSYTAGISIGLPPVAPPEFR